MACTDKIHTYKELDQLLLAAQADKTAGSFAVCLLSYTLWFLTTVPVVFRMSRKLLFRNEK